MKTASRTAVTSRLKATVLALALLSSLVGCATLRSAPPPPVVQADIVYLPGVVMGDGGYWYNGTWIGEPYHGPYWYHGKGYYK